MIRLVLKRDLHYSPPTAVHHYCPSRVLTGFDSCPALFLEASSYVFLLFASVLKLLTPHLAFWRQSHARKMSNDSCNTFSSSLFTFSALQSVLAHHRPT